MAQIPTPDSNTGEEPNDPNRTSFELHLNSWGEGGGGGHSTQHFPLAQRSCECRGQLQKRPLAAARLCD
jgi:hypothetical protein